LRGVASAAIGKVLGRAVHLAVPIPMSGSLVAALPRAVILLVVAARVRRCGALTVAAPLRPRRVGVSRGAAGRL